jgi:L-alanine-DL-glutamate epimerase-like enolase superfamily enzyme
VISLDVSAYTVPTERPESDGTLEWDSTTAVVVEAHSGGRSGLGYTYGPAAIGALVSGQLARAVEERDPLDIPGAWAAMAGALRNAVPVGLTMYAVAAVDIALWDLKARLLGVSVSALLGRRREAVRIYGSGGFTSYSTGELCEQLSGWVAQGIAAVKMKVGRDTPADPGRVGAAREAIGPDAELMVDANGAWTPAEAVAMAARFAEHGVAWLEEPVSSHDVAGLRDVRQRAPSGMAVAAGEYATDVHGFRRLFGAVDVLQADVTRCGGITGLLRADALCEAFDTPLSAHCAPAVSAHALVAAQRARHIEYFHDHVRVESELFDGVLGPIGGALRPDQSVPGLGLELKRADAERYLA